MARTVPARAEVRNVSQVTTPEAGLGRQTAGAVLWTTAQRWVARLGGFATVAILARLLAPREFGTVAVATTMLPIAYLLSDMGFSTYIVQVKDLRSRMLSSAFWFSTAIGTLLTGALMAAAPLLAALYHVPDAGAVVRGLAPTVLIVSVTAVPTALLRRRMRFRALAVQSFAGSTAGQIIAITLALLGFGVWALVLQTLAFQVVCSVFAWIAARWYPTLRFSREDFRTVASFGVKVASNDLIGVLREWAVNAIIAVNFGAVGLGYISVAQRLVQVSQDVTASAVLPVSTVMFAKVQDNAERLRSAYLRSQGLFCAVIVTVMVLVMIGSPTLVPLLFGDQWGPSVPLAQVLACVGILIMGAMLDQALFYGVGQPGRWFLYGLVIDVATLAAAAISAPHGLVTYCLGFLAVAVCATVVRWPLVARLVEVPWWRVALILGRAALSGALAAGAGLAAARVSGSFPPIITLSIVGLAVVSVQVASMRLFMRSELQEGVELARSQLLRFQNSHADAEVQAKPAAAERVAP